MKKGVSLVLSSLIIATLAIFVLLILSNLSSSSTGKMNKHINNLNENVKQNYFEKCENPVLGRKCYYGINRCPKGIHYSELDKSCNTIIGATSSQGICCG